MLDIKEEQKYERLRELSQKLHIPTFETFLTLEVFDKDGKLIQRHHQRSHSWTRNAYNFLFSSLAAKNADDNTFGAGKLSIKDTGAVVQYGEKPIANRHDQDHDTALFYGYIAPASSDVYGILVGYGTAAESFEDYVLENPIIEGTTDDGHHLSFAEGETHVISYASLVLTDTLVRYFNNNEATNSVDINEVALCLSSYVKGDNYKWLNSRDHLASTVTVPPTGQLKVTYTVQLTYPA